MPNISVDGRCCTAWPVAVDATLAVVAIASAIAVAPLLLADVGCLCCSWPLWVLLLLSASGCR